MKIMKQQPWCILVSFTSIHCGICARIIHLVSVENPPRWDKKIWGPHLADPESRVSLASLASLAFRSCAKKWV